MFTKEEYNKWLEDPTNQELNKKMVEDFPFLLPRNLWTDKVSEDYDYSFNKLWDLEKGWAKAFGYELICELRDVLIEAGYLDKYRITQIKEKYGGLCWYDVGTPAKAFDIIRKYVSLSYKTCFICGEPATHMTQGWVNYFCAKCGEKFGAKLIPEDWWEEDED